MSDFIYMQRVRDDLDIFSPEVSKFVFKENTRYSEDSPLIVDLKDELTSCLKPLEMRVSKSKEKGKGYFRYMLFCSRNLRLYNTIEEYFNDIDELKGNSAILDRKVERMEQLARINSSIVRDEIIGDEISAAPSLDGNDQETPETQISWDDF